MINNISYKGEFHYLVTIGNRDELGKERYHFESNCVNTAVNFAKMIANTVLRDHESVRVLSTRDEDKNGNFELILGYRKSAGVDKPLRFVKEGGRRIYKKYYGTKYAKKLVRK